MIEKYNINVYDYKANKIENFTVHAESKQKAREIVDEILFTWREYKFDEVYYTIMKG